MRFDVALLQILPCEGNLEKNLDKGIEYVKKAASVGADLVLFPELWSTGFPDSPFDDAGRREWQELAIDEQSAFFSPFRQAARDLHVNIALTYLERHDPNPRNTVSIIDGTGEVVLHHSKVFICNFGAEELLKAEPDWNQVGCDYGYSPGTTFDVCTLTGKEGEVKVGAMICADREFPEAATQLMLQDVELIVIPNACTWDVIRTVLLKATAFENLAGVAMANYPAPKNNGNSQAYDCAAWNGDERERDTVIVKAGEEEGVFIASFDLDLIRDFRREESWRTAYRKNWHLSRQSTP